jgi:hypothetical protein
MVGLEIMHTNWHVREGGLSLDADAMRQQKSRLAARRLSVPLYRIGLHDPLGRLVVMVLQAVFVAHHLAVQLVHQFIDCGIQIGMGAFGKHVAALDVDIAFGALPSFFFLLLFNGQEHFDINHLVKVAGNPVEFGCDVISQGRGNFKVMAADRQVHK